MQRKKDAAIRNKNLRVMCLEQLLYIKIVKSDTYISKTQITTTTVWERWKNEGSLKLKGLHLQWFYNTKHKPYLTQYLM